MKEQDPVVDKSLEDEFEVLYKIRQMDFPKKFTSVLSAVCTKEHGDDYYLRMAFDKGARFGYLHGAKESKSTAIADFILLLRKEFNDLPVHKWTAGDLMDVAEELKLKMEGK